MQKSDSSSLVFLTDDQGLQEAIATVCSAEQRRLVSLLLDTSGEQKAVYSQLLKQALTSTHPVEQGLLLIVFVFLSNAIQQSKADCLLKFLQMGFPVNTAQPDGSTLLHIAAMVGNLAAVEVLLAAGANPNAVNAEHYTALMVATYAQHQNVVDCLLQAGADAGLVNRYQLTALHIAAGNGNASICQKLLAAKADPNAKLQLDSIPNSTVAGYSTPLHLAQNDSVVRVLLASGADASLQDANGMPASALIELTTAPRI